MKAPIYEAFNDAIDSFKKIIFLIFGNVKVINMPTIFLKFFTHNTQPLYFQYSIQLYV